MNYRVLEVLEGPPLLTLEKARKHLNIIPDETSPPSHPDDDVIEDAIKDAIAFAENFTGRAITPKRYEATFACFPERYLRATLPFAAPLIDIESIRYIDTEGVEQVAAEDLYKARPNFVPAAFEQAFRKDWPLIAPQTEVVVTYTAGYDQPTLFPSDIMRALKQIMAEFFENREDSTPLNMRPIGFSAKNLLQPYRLYYRNAS